MCTFAFAYLSDDENTTQERMNATGLQMTIQDVIEYLGCTQNEMAELLGVSRRTFHYALTGERGLPDEATRAYLQLANAVAVVLPTAERLRGKGRAGAAYNPALLRKRLKFRERVMERLEKELSVMQTIHQQCSRSIEILKLMETRGLILPGQRTIKKWAQVIRARNELDCSRNTPDRQIELAARLAAVHAEVELLKNMLKQVPAARKAPASGKR